MITRATTHRARAKPARRPKQTPNGTRSIRGLRRSLINLVALLVAGVAGLPAAGCEEAQRGGEESPSLTDPGGKRVEATVTHVVDGDTARMLLDGASEDESVRYIGIDTPEVDPNVSVDCYGAEASERNRELLAGEQVTLEFGAERRDRFDRLLAYVYVGDTLVNARLVREGFARTLEIAPNTDFAPRFAELQQEAANAGRGLWGAC